MCDEYKALIDNNIWVLVPRPPNVNIVRSMWLYKHKYNANESLNWYKAQLVANGRSQQQGIDCDETFSPVVKSATIRNVLSLSFLDNGLFVTSSTSLLQRITSLLHAKFAMTDLGQLNYFLDISATRTTSGIFLSQKKYAIEIFEQAQMLNCNPCRTPIDTEKKLGPKGSLLIAYSDAVWAGCPATRRYTSGYCVFLGDNLVMWSFKRPDTLSRSSVEAEYRRVVNTVAETSWIRNLLRELHTSLFTATLVYGDHVSVIYMSANPLQHQRTKHIDINIHFVRDKVAAGHVRVLHVLSRF
nr:hypothetical protein [Tanacetum cinerariifolium]